jgi:hypothetical protein
MGNVCIAPRPGIERSKDWHPPHVLIFYGGPPFFVPRPDFPAPFINKCAERTISFTFASRPPLGVNHSSIVRRCDSHSLDLSNVIHRSSMIPLYLA